MVPQPFHTVIPCRLPRFRFPWPWPSDPALEIRLTGGTSIGVLLAWNFGKDEHHLTPMAHGLVWSHDRHLWQETLTFFRRVEPWLRPDRPPGFGEFIWEDHLEPSSYSEWKFTTRAKAYNFVPYHALSSSSPFSEACSSCEVITGTKKIQLEVMSWTLFRMSGFWVWTVEGCLMWGGMGIVGGK